jgi:hypothetical protein
MRTILELFKILKANKKLFIINDCSGLCCLIHKLYLNDKITYEEKDDLDTYINYNRPERGSKYYDSNRRGSEWYWELYNWHPRILWINAQIKMLSKLKKDESI